MSLASAATKFAARIPALLSRALAGDLTAVATLAAMGIVVASVAVSEKIKHKG